MKFDREWLEEYGFEGFVKIANLKKSCREIPDKPGVYVVTRESATPPQFREKSIGGFYNGENPTEVVAKLEENWVEGVCVVNFGQAGGGSSSKTLRSRIRLYMRYGLGKPVAHRGGRYIWQLEDCDELLVAWKALDESDDPREIEKGLIKGFRSAFGDKRPFANLQD